MLTYWFCPSATGLTPVLRVAWKDVVPFIRGEPKLPVGWRSCSAISKKKRERVFTPVSIYRCSEEHCLWFAISRRKCWVLRAVYICAGGMLPWSQDVVTLSLKNGCHCHNGQFLYQICVFVTHKNLSAQLVELLMLPWRFFFWTLVRHGIIRCVTESIQGLAMWSCGTWQCGFLGFWTRYNASGWLQSNHCSLFVASCNHEKYMWVC